MRLNPKYHEAGRQAGRQAGSGVGGRGGEGQQLRGDRRVQWAETGVHWRLQSVQSEWCTAQSSVECRHNGPHHHQQAMLVIIAGRSSGVDIELHWAWWSV